MSKHHYHAVIWIDHHEARVFHFSMADVERLVLHPDHPTRHIHHKANSIGSGHASEDHDYLHAAAESIADAGAVLITGPANAKTELVKHIHHHDPNLMNVIVGVETVDHPSDAQLVAYARKYFKATDRMQPQKPQARPFSRGALYYLLRNRLYRGEAVHKGVAHPGEHDAVIEGDLWQTVQAKLSAHASEQRRGRAESGALLMGLLLTIAATGCLRATPPARAAAIDTT